MSFHRFSKKLKLLFELQSNIGIHAIPLLVILSPKMEPNKQGGQMEPG